MDKPQQKFSNLTFEELRVMQDQWVNERDWDQFHTPRNLLLAMVGEVGEVSELFQWRGEVKPGLPDWSPTDKEALKDELADVLNYLIRLSDKCDIDLVEAVLNKSKKNSIKYPKELVKGSSKSLYTFLISKLQFQKVQENQIVKEKQENSETQ